MQFTVEWQDWSPSAAWREQVFPVSPPGRTRTHRGCSTSAARKQGGGLGTAVHHMVPVRASLMYLT